MIIIRDKTKCTGCSACLNTCPKDAVSLKSDKEGFVYPVVDKSLCVDCSLCEKSCPIISKPPTANNFSVPTVYAAWNKDEQVRIQSTSGGVYSALAEKFIQSGGVVVGAEYTDDFSIKHTIIDSIDGIKRQRQSKYAQSDLGCVFRQIKSLLKSGEKVLFCGTPCQNAGLKNYLTKDYENLFLCDFICRGIISQKVYKKYLASVERHSNSAISKVHFKNKDFGWNRFSTKLTLQNGNSYHKDRFNDEYMVGLLKHNLYLRPSCHECHFKELPRVSDITLGDFWGIGSINSEWDCDKGTSVVLINSAKGQRLFDPVKDTALVSHECQIDDVTKGNYCLLNTASVGEYRKFFFDNFERKDFIDLIHKIDKKSVYKTLSLRDKLYTLKSKLLHKN